MPSDLTAIARKIAWLAILGALVLFAGRVFSNVQTKAARA